MTSLMSTSRTNKLLQGATDWKQHKYKQIEDRVIYWVQMLMLIVSLPAYYMHCAVDKRYPLISDIMPINRYRKLHQYIYFNDNEQVGKKQ